MHIAMSQHIVDLIEAHVTEHERDTVATAIGEPIDKTRLAMDAGIDAMVASLTRRVASTGGAESVWRALHTPMFGGVDGMWMGFLGEDGEKVDDVVAQASGLERAPAHRVVAALLPIVASVLMDATGGGRGGVAGLRKLFESKASVKTASGASAKKEPAMELATAPRTKPVWLPLAVVIGAIGLGAVLLLRAPEPQMSAIPEPVPVAGAPAPTSVTSTTSAEVPKVDLLAEGFEAAEPAKVTLWDVTFEPRTTTLHSGKSTIDKLAGLMNDHPSTKLRVEGHTDSTGSEDANEALSLKRAAAVKKLLVDEGVSAERIEAVGMGPRAPVSSNDTEEGRKMNRRIEVVIVKH